MSSESLISSNIYLQLVRKLDFPAFQCLFYLFPLWRFVMIFFYVRELYLPLALFSDGKSNPPTGINQHFIDFLHNERVNFPCGWPNSGIGPIEPHRIAQFNVILDSASEFTK
jgi:hypothetical protein